MRAIPVLLGWVCWAVAGASGPTRPVAASPEFIDAVTRVFARGYDNPASGSFCEADIAVEDPLRLRSVKGRATGWILRVTADGTGDFLGWNGLTYKAGRIGPAKDVAAYVQKWVSHPPRRSGVAELDSASDPRTALGIAFLVRLGRSDLAESMAHRLKFRAALLVEQLGFVVLSFRFDRALALISAGKDEIAYRDLAWVASNEDLLYELVRSQWRPLPEELNQTPYLAEIAKARAERPAKRPFSLEENRRLSTQERVAQIIEYLDDARFTISDKPTRKPWRQPAVCRAALEVGRPALEALIACVRSDHRYTRAVLVDPPANSLPLIGVDDLAMRLAMEIGNFNTVPADVRSDTEWEQAMSHRASLPTPAEELERAWTWSESPDYLEGFERAVTPQP